MATVRVIAWLVEAVVAAAAATAALVAWARAHRTVRVAAIAGLR